MNQFEIKPVNKFGVVANKEGEFIRIEQGQDAAGKQDIVLYPDEAKKLGEYLTRTADEMDSEQEGSDADR